MIVGKTVREKGYEAGYDKFSYTECIRQLSEYDDHFQSMLLKNEWINGYYDGEADRSFDNMIKHFIGEYND